MLYIVPLTRISKRFCPFILKIALSLPSFSTMWRNVSVLSRFYLPIEKRFTKMRIPIKITAVLSTRIHSCAVVLSIIEVDFSAPFFEFTQTGCTHRKWMDLFSVESVFCLVQFLAPEMDWSHAYNILHNLTLKPFYSLNLFIEHGKDENKNVKISE